MEQSAAHTVAIAGLPTSRTLTPPDVMRPML